MRKKQEFPRKRKRHIKRVLFFSSLGLTVLLIVVGVSFYSLFEKLQKPLFVSPLPLTQTVQADQGGKAEDALQAGLRKNQIEYTTISKENDSFIVTLQNGGKVTFSTQKDIMTQIASLQYILSHLTMEGRQFSSLDLRFDQPVIVIK